MTLERRGVAGPHLPCSSEITSSRLRGGELSACPVTAMVMSQGTYTFLACFAGFWLVWAVIVMLCCFCSFLQRRLKRRHEERLREQCLRTVEMEPLSGQPAGYPPVPPPPPPLPAPPLLPREPPQFCPPQTLSPPVPLSVPHPMPQANWVSMPGNVKGLLLFAHLFSSSACHSVGFPSSGELVRLRDSVFRRVHVEYCGSSQLLMFLCRWLNGSLYVERL